MVRDARYHGAASGFKDEGFAARGGAFLDSGGWRGYYSAGMNRSVLAFLLALAAAARPCAQGTAAAPTRYTLQNGLAVCAVSDRSVPLVRIQIAFKAGGVAQGAETAGHFRLLERALLAGTEGGAPSATAVALAGLGATAVNGGVGPDGMSYWIALPSALLPQGLDFFAKAFGGPVPPAAELGPALAEAGAAARDPAWIFQAALDKRLFSKYPWRLDLAGGEPTLKGATARSLEALRATWLAPSNAALFVGGDVDPETVRAEAGRAFAGWKAAPDPWAKPLSPQAKPGVARPTWIVYPDPALPEGLAAVEARYRGPDPASDPGASAAALLWAALVEDSRGRFKAALAKDVPKLQGADSVSAVYVPRRDSSYLAVGAFLATDPAAPAVDRARLFKERARAFELTAMKAAPAKYFAAEELEAAKKRAILALDAAMEGADRAVAALSEAWLSSSIEARLGLPAALARTGAPELASFLDAYFMKNLEVVSLRMNPADYEREKKSFANSGFELISESNAFWWRK